MNILIVDDQIDVLNSLKNGVKWEEYNTDMLYSASGASEAKLLLNNFHIDLLISDIEMPGEDGIELCRWAKERFKDIEVVFLTSHTDFVYAQKAIGIGAAEYLLQPVDFKEVEEMLLNMQERISKKIKAENAMLQQKRVLGQQNTLLDGMILNLERGNTEEADNTYNCLKELLDVETDNGVIYPILFQIVKWKKINQVWDDARIKMVVCSILDDLFEDVGGKAGIASINESEYWIFLLVKKDSISIDRIRKILVVFEELVNNNCDFYFAMYPCFNEMPLNGAYEELKSRMNHNKAKKPGIIYEDIEQDEAEVSVVDLAISYIRSNLKKNLNRTEVAEYVHLNEEYFSRLFKKETGVGFKEFVLFEKMNEAQKLLSKSKLPVEVIASKTGYTNLSNFSSAFKKVTGVSPQEYRKSQNQK